MLGMMGWAAVGRHQVSNVRVVPMPMMGQVAAGMHLVLVQAETSWGWGPLRVLQYY